MMKKDAFAYPERYARTIFDTTNLLSEVELCSTVIHSRENYAERRSRGQPSGGGLISPPW
jgi:hypothetical protein